MVSTLVLENIRSIHNTASLFRTADAAGVSKIILTGHTPAPIDRFGRKVGAFSKVSLGAEENMRWEYVSDPSSIIDQIQKEGGEVCALEQDPRSVLYTAYTPRGDFALIVGNEVEGVSSALREKANHIIEIPMRGKKESLNVAVAAGVALFHFLT